ncbi:MAG: fused MFS/spermidine synthase [Myxococcota bacterium]|jgi:spermidine synthase|nr:fused MFS/spermidine synthase [Myxococcota bacterium]
MTDARDGKASAGSAVRWLYVFAFVSGMSALTYELAWTRMLALTFGRTTLAASAVVGGFMGGMGVGAWLFHRLLRSGRSPLRLYAGLEAGIAISTAILTAGFVFLPGFFATVSHSVPAGLAMTLFRVGFVFFLLLLPAALMGATYPALCSVLIHSKEDVEQHLGRIYGLNTIGAAVGAMVAGLVLIELMGLRGSVIVANLMNLAVALGAWLLARHPLFAASNEEAATATARDDERAVPSQLPWVAVAIVLFGSGLATLSYEIVWFRALRYLFGNSTYALTLMLVVFLLGLGFGGMCFRGVVRRGGADRVLGWSQLAIALLALFAIGGLGFILGDPELSKRISAFSQAASERSWQLRLATEFAVALLLLLPATLVMGLSYPLATSLLLGNVRRVGAQVGVAYFLANLGSIAGAVLGAVFFLPQFGTVGGTQAIAMINVALATFVISSLPAKPLARFAPLVVGGALLITASLVLPERLAFNDKRVLKGGGVSRLIFEEEGDLATVQVHSDPKRPERRGLSVDGSQIGVSRGVRYGIYSKQLLLAHLPMVIDPSIESTLNIGLGSGSTLDALASHASVQQLEAVEISAAVARGSLLFEESKVLRDPRVRLEVEDISHYLLRSSHRYDLIISDGKQGADFSGNVVMLCLEFYTAASRRLHDDGLLVQWIPQDLPHAQFAAILRTFQTAFPHVEVFYEAPGAVMLVGSRTAIDGREHMGASHFRKQRIRSDLDQFLIPSPEAMLSRWVASGEDLDAVLEEGPIITWNDSTFDFAVYKATPRVWREARPRNLGLLVEATKHALRRGRQPFLPTDAPFATSSRLMRSARLADLRGNLQGAAAFAESAWKANPDDPRAEQAARGLRRRLERGS